MYLLSAHFVCHTNISTFSAVCLRSGCREVIAWRWRAARMRSLPICITFVTFLVITYITTPEYFRTAFHTRTLPWRLQFFGVLYVTWERYFYIAWREMALFEYALVG